MKRAFSRAVALFLVAALFTLTIPRAHGVSAESYILLDGNTGAQLAGKNVHEKALIASTTKIMTAVVVLETMDVDAIISVPQQAVGVEGSSMYLQAGEKLSVLNLLYGLMLQSGNDAAVTLAIGSQGSVSAFVEKMNEKARILSLKNTHFENPHGLDGNEHYSSAYDLGILTAYAMKNPAFRQIVSRKEISFGTRSLRNHNRLLWMLDGVIGVKTGYTKAAGRILVSALEHQGRLLIAVTINDGNDWQDHISLYDYGKSLYSCRKIFEEGSFMGHIPLGDGSTGAIYASESFTAYLAPEESPVLYIRYPRVPMGSCGIAVLDVYVGDLHLGSVFGKWEVITNGTNSKSDCLPGTVFPP